MTNPLPADSPHATRLHDYLCTHWALNGDLALPKASYQMTPVLSVPRIPDRAAKALQCWFNVEDAVKSGKGTAVFGWTLWCASWADGYLAQPHAVLMTLAGELVCITPSEPGMAELEHITFFADPRIPFDYDTLRVPLMLAYDVPSKNVTERHFRWLDFGQEVLDVPGAWTDTRPDNFNMGCMR
jgi:hypothetical protein